MRHISRHRPSPAMVVALLALVVALGGTAIAANVNSSNAPTAGAAKSKKHKKKKSKTDTSDDTKLVKKLAKGLSVRHASSADSALPTGSAGGALTGNYPNPGLAPPEGLHAITFQNGWSDYGLNQNPAGFYKDSFGIVHLSGGMHSGTLGVTAFALPAGYRPSGVSVFPVISSTGGGGAGAVVPADLSVTGFDGTVVVETGGNNAFVGLDGITFRATQ